MPTVMFTCRGHRTCTHTLCKHTPVPKTWNEDSPFSRKNVKFFLVEKEDEEGKSETGRKRIDRTNGQRANPDVLTILYRIRRDEYSFVGKIDSSIDAHRPRWTESRYSIGFVFDSVFKKTSKASTLGGARLSTAYIL